MSIVIPAGHLAHTVITVRCDSPHAAPHIECALDEQTSFGNTPREQPKSPVGIFASDGRPTASSSTAFTTPSSPLSVSQVDLSVERGMDHRGHFVRLSFLPNHRTQYYGTRPLGHEIPDASYLSLGDSLSGPTLDVSSKEVNSSRTAASNSPPSMGGNPLAYSSTPIMNNVLHAAREADPVCLENMNFMSSSDVELMTALDSFMGIFDPHADYPMLDVGVPGGIAPHALNQLSEPSSPQMSSSSSSSCGSSSPITPCDFFLPATTPTSDDGGRNDVGDTADINCIQSSSERSLQKSPVLSQLAPGPDPKCTIPNKAESRLLPCPQPGCKRQFKSTSTLGGHMKTHAGKGIRFQCSFPPCTEKFSRRHDQLRHEVYKHGKRCEWVCARCNSFFSYERSLEKHVCTMDKSRRGSMPYSVTGASDSGPASGAGR
ncbi:hypothetical protein ACEPAF_8369 [Sanghuangporus sanghuang]